MSPSSLRRLTLCAFGALFLLGTLASSAAADSKERGKVLERPVSFRVANVNQSKLACATDGVTYTIRGHIVGTKAELESNDGATLYVHGIGLGQFFWNFHGVPGYDFAAGLARDGHVSVVIDKLGYDTSGKPEGMGSCQGGQATIAHQIIGDLKSGRYGGTTTPEFKRVGLIGHSAGGQIAEIEGYSFRDAAAIGVLAYSDRGFSEAQLKAAADAAAICAAGGQLSEETSGPGGYAKFGQATAEAEASFFSSAAPKVQRAALPLLTANPCGDLASYAAAPSTNLANVGKIKVPVLAVQGGRDALFPAPDVKRQSKLFTGSPAVTYANLPRSAHALTLESEHDKLVALVARFLDASGL